MNIKLKRPVRRDAGYRVQGVGQETGPETQPEIRLKAPPGEADGKQCLRRAAY